MISDRTWPKLKKCQKLYPTVQKQHEIPDWEGGPMGGNSLPPPNHRLWLQLISIPQEGSAHVQNILA